MGTRRGRQERRKLFKKLLQGDEGKIGRLCGAKELDFSSKKISLSPVSVPLGAKVAKATACAVLLNREAKHLF